MKNNSFQGQNDFPGRMCKNDKETDPHAGKEMGRDSPKSGSDATDYLQHKVWHIIAKNQLLPVAGVI